MKYAFIQKQALDEFSIARFCKILEVSRSGYYEWLNRPESNRAKVKALLIDLITKISEKSHKAYGSPRIHQALKQQGTKCSKRTVEKLMQQNNIKSIYHRRFRPMTTDSKNTKSPAPNVLNRDFKATRPNQKWVSDITYISTQEGWLYLCVFIDLFSRQVVGHAMSATIDAELVCSAFKHAITRRGTPSEIVIHSDRGSQYASLLFQTVSNLPGLTRSMSRVGNCYDNAVCESFFKSLKVAHVYQNIFYSKTEARLAVAKWIDLFYNSERLHSTLGFRSPAEFENLNLAA